ncbi:MAG: hypothetical protein E7422_10275 [Ruminococcaceae bacterium]|nr:hypothetical protein [Oscillospiraceae bacterium]
MNRFSHCLEILKLKQFVSFAGEPLQLSELEELSQQIEAESESDAKIRNIVDNFLHETGRERDDRYIDSTLAHEIHAQIV